MDGRLFFFITSSWMHHQQKSSMQKKFMVEKSWKLSSVRAERKTTTRYFQIFDIFLDNDDIPYISWTRTSFRQSELSLREYLKIGCNKKVVGHLKNILFSNASLISPTNYNIFLLNSKLERLQIPRAIFRTLMRRSLLFYSFCSHCKTSKKKLARAAFAEQKWQQDCPWHWTSGSGSMRGN